MKKAQENILNVVLAQHKSLYYWLATHPITTVYDAPPTLFMVIIKNQQAHHVQDITNKCPNYPTLGKTTHHKAYRIQNCSPKRSKLGPRT